MLFVAFFNMKNNKRNINKDIIPEGFTLGLACVDMLPVLFFGIAGLILAFMLQSYLFGFFAATIFVSGALKVLWKVLVVIRKENVWPLFLQMRIALPLGFLGMIAYLIVKACTSDLTPFWNSFVNPVTLTLLSLSATGMALMITFALTLNPADKKSNWIEQITNSAAQFLFMLAIIFACAY